MKVKPFEYVLVYVPEDEDTLDTPEIVAGPEVILARDVKHAEQLAVRALPDEYVDALGKGEVGVYVRPF